MTDAEQTELFSLIGAVCDEVADDEQLARLTTLLQDPEARRHYLNYVDLNFELAEQISMLPATAPKASDAPVWRRPWFAAAAAAAVLLISALVYQQLTGESRKPATIVEAPAPPSVPAVTVGHILATATGVNEATSELPLLAGQVVTLGEAPTVMQIGRTRIYAAGPGEIRASSATAVELRAGRLVAISGEGDAGFAVTTPHCTVTDRGTVFTVESGPVGTSTQVLEGSVEVKRGDNLRTLLPGGQLFRAADRKRTASEDLDLVPFRPLLELSAGGLVSEGALTPLPAPAGYLSDSIRVWPEATDTILPKDLAITFSKPGKYTKATDVRTIVPAGTEVDSYMVFYRPNRRKGKFSQTGLVRFPRKIIGIICVQHQLQQSASIFAAPPRPDSVLSRIFIDKDDHVIIGPDQQTLQLRLTNSAAFSSTIRVLLAAD